MGSACNSIAHQSLVLPRNHQGHSPRIESNEVMTTPTTKDFAVPRPVTLGAISGILAVLGVVGLLTANPLESVFAIFQLAVLVRAYWRQNTPPVVLLLFLIPWKM